MTVIAHRARVTATLHLPAVGTAPFSCMVMLTSSAGVQRHREHYYAQALNEAGVPATFTLGHGHIHVSPAFTKVMASARAWRDEAVAVLRRAHDVTSATAS